MTLLVTVVAFSRLGGNLHNTGLQLLR